MLFNSLEFLFFFPIATTLYFILPDRFRIGLLLVASCLFYMAFIPAYILVLVVLITIDYFMGIRIEEAPKSQKKYFLTISILATCLALFVFKYFNFFAANCQTIAHLIGWNYPVVTLQIILPLGLSFHTFQSLSYIIEVYKGEQKTERNFWVYALYVMFYPQLVAGPIERPGHLLHQFYEKHYFDYQRVTSGLKLMAWGLFKKMAIADSLVLQVNPVYNDPTAYHGPALALATFFFAIQIYCDFSGYSDIAIGAAEVMGFRLIQNFNRPYFSKSIPEFWKRWHISLSTWFRDYVYIPLGGNRVPKIRWELNILITFLLSGVWHGANWTFVIWGALHGCYYLFSCLTKWIREKFKQVFGLYRWPGCLGLLQIICTFTLVYFSWIFFRARNVNTAFYIITHLGQDWQHLNFMPDKFYNTFGVEFDKFRHMMLRITFLIVIEIIQTRGSIRQMIASKPVWVRWGCYYLLVWEIFIGSKSGSNPFIYFQF